MLSNKNIPKRCDFNCYKDDVRDDKEELEENLTVLILIKERRKRER